MTENKHILLLTGTMLLAVVIFCFGTRYQMVGVAEHEDHFIYMYDRMTRRIWGIYGTGVQGVCIPVLSYEEAIKKYRALKRIADWRKDYPMYNNLSDQELAESIYKKYYFDMPKEEFMSEVLRKPPLERPLGDPD